MSKLTKNGVSTTKKGQFQYEEYYCSITKKTRVQWDYRDPTGKLHSGIVKDVASVKNIAAGFGLPTI